MAEREDRSCAGELALLRAALDRGPGAAGAGDHPDESVAADYLLGVLAPEAIEDFERHVGACARCAEELVVAHRLEREAAPGLAGAPREAAQAARAATGSDALLSRTASDGGQVSRPAARRSGADAGAGARARPRRTGRARRFAIAAGLVLAVTAGLLAVGGQMALDRLRPLAVAEGSRWLERSVTVEGLGFALAGGPGLRLTGVAIGDDPRYSSGSFAEIGDAVLHTDVAALLRGRLEGSVALDRAVVRLVRVPGGSWNVETLGGASDAPGTGAAKTHSAPARAPDAARAGDARGVRLTSARIRDGVLEVADRSQAGGTAKLVVSALDLDVQSPDPGRPARLTLAGDVGRAGDDRAVAVSGEIGPFTRGATPSWRLDQVALERLPLADIPGAPESVRGELTFRGRLESSGDGIAAVVANAVGSGELEIARGSLGDGNLGRDVIAALAAELAAGRAPGDAAAAPAVTDLVLAAAARDPSLAAVLASPETAFDALGGSVQLTASALELREVGLDTSVVDARASGTLARGGEIAAAGRLTVEPALAAAIVQAAPAMRPLLGADGRLAVPFRATGAWPKLRLDLDLAQAVASAAHLDPRVLRLALAAPRASLASFLAGRAG